MKQKLLFTLVLLLGLGVQLYAQLSNRQVADQWLEKHKETLLIQPNHSLEMLFSRSGLSGETFRYYQKLNDVQVFNAEITVHVSNSGKVSFHESSYLKDVETINTNPTISEVEALQLALINLNVQPSDVLQSENKLYVLQEANVTTLVRRLYIYAYSKTGAWEVMVDAQTGTILSSKDVAIYYNHEKDKNKGKSKKQTKNTSISTPTTGIGFIFDTDPLTATTSSYGGQYVDGNDATNATLDAARTMVNLPEIDVTGGQYTLKSSLVEIAELDTPNKGLFIQGSSDFSFNRQEDGFEAVNVFYHVDKSMRYINNDLGIAMAPPQNGGVVRFDPHGADGNDNSFQNFPPLSRSVVRKSLFKPIFRIV